MGGHSEGKVGGQNKDPAPRGRGASTTDCRKQDLQDPEEPNVRVASRGGHSGIVRLTAHGGLSPLAPTAGIAANYSGRAARRILFCGLLPCPPRSLLTRIALYVNGGASLGLDSRPLFGVAGSGWRTRLALPLVPLSFSAGTSCCHGRDALSQPVCRGTAHCCQSLLGWLGLAESCPGLWGVGSLPSP